MIYILFAPTYIFRTKYLSHLGKSKVTVRKKKTFGRQSGKGEYNTKIVLKRNEGRYMNSCHSAQLRDQWGIDVRTEMNHYVPQNTGKCFD